MIHHSLTKDSGSVSWGAIRRYHTLNLGWDDIGYHFGVELVGEFYEILIGRSLQKLGAHCYQEGMNRKAIGICLVGNYDNEPPYEGQLVRTVELVEGLLEQFKIPIDNIVAHRDYAPYKSCPGDEFSMIEFKKRLNK